MAGHSHWAGIKRKKALIDNKRGRLFSALAKNIISSARAGSDPDANLQLRYAIDAAKAANMPKKNIERAVLKGSGQLPGVTVEDITYEGYGPGGAAVLVETITDSKNRTAAEMRKLFDTHNGNLAGSGSVAWMFDQKGLIAIDESAISEDDLMELALEFGADDVNTESGVHEVTCSVEDFRALSEAIRERGVETSVCEISRIPQNTVKLSVSDGRKMLKFMETLEYHDDVQHTYSNFDLPEELMTEEAE